MNRILKSFSPALVLVLLMQGIATAQPRGGRGPASRPFFQIAKVPIDPKLPTLWIIGDSTVRQGVDNGSEGQWGWGNPIRHYFDETKINIQNRAVGGTSSKTFMDLHWSWIMEEIKPGDLLILQFGHNDSGTPKGNGDEVVERPVPARRGGRGATQPAVAEATPATQPVQMQQLHSFGWNLRKYISDAKAKGASYAVICSPIPRNNWADGTIRADGWIADCKTAAETSGARFLDLNALIIEKYKPLGQQKVDELYFPDHDATTGRPETTHTNWAGAILNAECVIAGLKQIDSPLVKYLKPVPPTDLKHPSNRAR